MEDKLKKVRCLNSTTLKLIAMLSMLIDHMGAVFFHDLMWMRAIGRLAMPLYAFCVSEGFALTHDRKKYLKRLLIFALISEIPFDLAFYGKIGSTHQNVMFTFAISVAALMLFDRLKEKGSTASSLLAYFSLAVMGLIAMLLRTDYGYYGVFLVAAFYISRDKGLFIRDLCGTAWQLAMRNVGIHLIGSLSFIPILMYNGEKGRGLKWFFYCFYPGHLLLFGIIRYLI